MKAPPLERGEPYGRNPQVDKQPPVVPLVHIYVTDLQGVAAVEVTGDDGEEYCVLDRGVLDGNPDAREKAHQAFLRACKRASRRNRPGLC